MAKQNKSLNEFYPNVLSKEPSIRLDCFPALENYLSDRNNSIYCEDLTGFIDGVLKWIEGSNYRVRLFFFPINHQYQSYLDIQISYNGLRLLELFTQRLDSHEFENYLDNGMER